MIATPFYDFHGFAPYISSLASSVMIMQTVGIQTEYLTVCGNAYIEDARNTLARLFLSSDFTHLIFIDSDLQWDITSLINLILADEEIVGATFRFKSDDVDYPCTIKTDNINYKTTDTHAGPPIVTDKGLISATRIPTGFMKIKRSVFEKLINLYPDNFYYSPYTEEKTYDFFGRMLKNHKKLGEDISFNQRCIDAGIKLFIEPRCTLTHWGTKGWKGNYHEYLLAQPQAKPVWQATPENLIAIDNKLKNLEKSLTKIIDNSGTNDISVVKKFDYDVEFETMAARVRYE
jgi:hypothetical protein